MIGLLGQYNEFVMFLSLFAISVTSFWMAVYIFNRKSILSAGRNRSFFPSLSVIIPAHNEEKEISKTLRALLKSKYPKKKMEIIVVNDGSTDKTASLVNKFPVRLINNVKKLGKVASLNKAIAKAKGEIVVTMDADSIVNPHSLSLLVMNFKDKEVGAVSGVYKTRHESRLLEKMQGLEYLWFAFVRKTQEMMNCVLVVPGALAAFRRDVLKEVNGFDSDTMIEDFDMTIKIHKAGYKVRCNKNATATVCAPSNILDLIKQRTRWFRGGLQVYVKHADIFKGRAGMVSAVWIIEVVGIFLQMIVFSVMGFEIIKYITMYPFAELLLGLKMFLIHLLTLNVNIAEAILAMTGFLFILGMVHVALSINMMKESKKKILLYPLMMIYSSFLSFIFLKSFVEEIIGVSRTWSSQHGNC